MGHDETNLDDGVRASVGLVASLRDLEDGQSRLIFDDVVLGVGGNRRDWRDKCFYTQNRYPNFLLNEMGLSDDQFREIGMAVVARLLAVNGRLK